MKQCPYCNAQIADNSKFCGECGKELPQENVCTHCGATVNEGDIYCEICGRNLKNGSYVSSDDGKSGIDYMKILLSSLLGIIVGIVILAVIGGSWYGCNEYAAYKERAAAREKFVTDSLEQVRKDSIKIVERKEQERINAEKFAEFQEKFTFKNVLALLKQPNNAALAEKCGLSVIEGVFSDTKRIVYGYDVKKGEQLTTNEYELKPTSKHACSLVIYMYDKVSADLSFIDKSDADALFNMAKDYGLIECQDNYYIPTNKIANGITVVDELESIDGGVQFMIVEPREGAEWSFINIWSQE